MEKTFCIDDQLSSTLSSIHCRREDVAIPGLHNVDKLQGYTD